MLRGIARSIARLLRSLADQLERFGTEPDRPEIVIRSDDPVSAQPPRYVHSPHESYAGTVTSERLTLSDQLKREREKGLTPHQESLISTLPPRGWLGFVGSLVWETMAFLSQSMVVWLVVITLLVGGVTVSMVYKIVDDWNETIEILENDANRP